MKEKLRLLLMILLGNISFSYAQQATPSHLLQFYFDDDYINFYGKGTDKAYTNGTKYTLFYTKKSPSQSLIERIMPKAGDSSQQVFGVGISQTIFTPNDISDPNFQPNDYPWSGSLNLTYKHYSYNEKKKYGFQTELDLGISGPASMAKQVQKTAHKLISYQEPNGWANQFRNNLIVNLNFTAEKQLLKYGKFVEIIGGGQMMIGTGMNSTAAYSLIRIGKMNPYFQGLIRQFSTSGTTNNVQVYLVFKPKVQWVLTNALLQGGINTAQPLPMVVQEKNNTNLTYQPLKKTVASYAFGVVLVINRFSISSIQTSSTNWMKNLYSNTWGNFTMTYNL